MASARCLHPPPIRRALRATGAVFGGLDVDAQKPLGLLLYISDFALAWSPRRVTRKPRVRDDCGALIYNALM